MTQQLAANENIENKIYIIRGHKMMLDEDLAGLYGVRTKSLNLAVRRNIKRFPSDFMFRVTPKEYESLRFQIETLEAGRGQHRKYLPYAFMEPGVAMLSSVLRSERAIKVNVQIMRTFIKIREMISKHKDLHRKIDELEKKFDHQFQVVFASLRKILEKPEDSHARVKGFISD